MANWGINLTYLDGTFLVQKLNWREDLYLQKKSQIQYIYNSQSFHGIKFQTKYNLPRN